MKVLWSIIAVLVLAGVALLARSWSLSSPQIEIWEPTRTVIDDRGNVVSTETPKPTATTPAKDTPAALPSPVDFEKDLSSAIGRAIGTHDQPSTVTGAALELPFNAAFPAKDVIAAKGERLADGTLLIDKQYKVTGKGTKAEPYVVPFDLLLSASSTYDPRKGLTRLPQRVTFLHESWVKITGYIAFPISSTDPKEALVMFNQWDGCCIGVPPSAYDAVEVKLAKPASGDERFVSHGSLSGKFSVAPYSDGGWLIGLYIMEEASLKGDEFDSTKKRSHDNQ